MPEVKKQSPRTIPNSTPTSHNGILSRIAPVKATTLGRLKVALYGTPKTGKTRLACSFPKPLLLIGAEDGTASIVGMQGVEFVQLLKLDELRELIDGPIRAGKYKTVVLDTATKLRDIRITEIIGLETVPEQKGWGFAKREQWMQCAQNLKDALRPLLDLPRTMALNVVVISQEQNLTGGEEGQQSELIRPMIGSALGKSLCEWLHAECDYVCQTLIREETIEQTVKIGNADSIQKRKTGKMEYCLRVGPHEVYQTGFRLPGGRTIEQQFLVNPSYDKIAAMIQGK